MGIAFWRGMLAIVAFLSLSACGPITQEPSIPISQGKTIAISNFKIPSFDGTLIDLNLFIPDKRVFGGKRPALIFLNSWILDKHEYFLQAQKFAKKGYIVLSYTTRGFGQSGGVVTGAGPKDIKDVSWIIDWLIENTAVDSQCIGMCGISFGGGIPAIALAKESRISAIAMLSSWSDLYKAFYHNNTFKEFWSRVLLRSGQISSRLAGDFEKIFNSLKIGDEKPWIKEWARIRSSSTYIEAINSRKVPILISNNYKDNLFSPNLNVEFFQQLKGAKKFLISPGIHASAEMSGVIGFSNEIWREVHDWFDHWLRGINSKGIMDKPPIKITGEDGSTYFDEFPEPTKDKRNYIKLIPQNRFKNNSLFLDYGKEWGEIEVSSAGRSGAGTGIPLLVSFLDSHTPIKIYKWMPLINKRYGAVFYSQRLSQDIKLQGASALELWIKPLNKKIQLVVYIYDVNRFNVGRLITHGVYSCRDCVVGNPFSLRLKLDTTSHRFKKGHKIGIVIDTHDPLYSRVDNRDFRCQIMHHKDKLTRLFFP